MDLSKAGLSPIALEKPQFHTKTRAILTQHFTAKIHLKKQLKNINKNINLIIDLFDKCCYTNNRTIL